MHRLEVVQLGPLFDDLSASFMAHPLGDMVVGKAMDNVGRVEVYKNLYVMDGASILGSTGAVNSTLTISARAERSIAAVIKNSG